MGPHSAVQLYSRLFFLLALGHAAVLELEVLPGEKVALSPDDLCPCTERAECPREFGTKPEDELAGTFPPCEDPGWVRCCGVSVEQTVSTGVRESPDEAKNADEEAAGPALPPGIVIPVPAVFPEYLDTRSSTVSPQNLEEGDSYYDYYGGESDEAITDVEKDAEDQRRFGESPTSEISVVESSQRELNSSKSVKGENIDESISQTDASVSSDYLDYRGVNKYGVKGGVQTITGSEHRGEISSSKRVESDEKTESIVDDGYSGDSRAPETMPELAREEEEKLSTQSEFGKLNTVSSESTDSGIVTKGVELRQNFDSQNPMAGAENVDLVEVDHSLEKMEPVSGPVLGLNDDRLDDSSSGSRRETVFQNHQESSSHQENEKAAAKTSNFEESSSSGVAVENGAGKEVETSGQTDGRRRIPTITIRELESAINSRGRTDYRTRGVVSNQQRSQSVTKESRNVEENTSSNDESVAMSDERQAKVSTIANLYGRRRRPAITVPRVTSNPAMETALRTRGLKRKSLRFEENSSSNVQSGSSGTGNPDHASNAEIIVTTARPAPELRRPPSVRSRMLSSQRRRVSPQQRKESTRDDPYLEKTTASSVQTVAPNTEELSHGVASLEKVGTASTDEPNRGQREETDSNREINETVVKGSSILEENGSANADEATIANETTSNADPNATMTINEAVVIQETVPRLMDSPVDVQQQTGASGEREDQTANPKKEDIASTPSLWNLVTGKQSVGGEVISKSAETERISHSAVGMDREEDTRSVLVGSRTYIPVLVNTEFLRDPAIAALTLGQDPVSGVTQSDMMSAKRAPEVLPLSCGNVVFGERFKDGKTLVCNIPMDVVSPISPRELNGPMLPDATMTGVAEARLEADDAVRSEPESITVNRNAEDSMARDSLMSDSHIEESPKTTTVEAEKNERPISSMRRTRVRRPIQAPVAEEHREREAEDLPKPMRRLQRGRIRHRTVGRQPMPEVERTNAVEEDHPAVESRRLSASVRESESLPNPKQGAMAGPDFDVLSAEEYEAARETAVRNSRSYTPLLVPILPRRWGDSPEAKVSKKKSRNLSSEKKLFSKDLEVAKLKTEFVDIADDSGTPTFVSNRNNRQAIEFAPEKKGVTISPDDLSMTGRISVVGLLPAGFKDPALDAREDELGIDLPQDSFRPSPIDPINWP